MICMKLLGHPISSMHLWAIFLLLAISAISSYTLGIFPYLLVLSVATSLAAEAALVKFYLKARLRLPLSGIITGLLIGMIAPQNAPALLVIAASLIAILSKFVIKSRHNIIFNPAALGLIVALALFHAGDVWWASSSYNLSGTIISFVPILAIPAYLSRRLVAGLGFIVASIIIGALIYSNLAPLSAGFISMLFSVNYLFAFIMVGDPKTSPVGNKAQAVYGVLIAAMVFATGYSKIPYPFLISLLAANLLFALYRSRHMLIGARHIAGQQPAN